MRNSPCAMFMMRMVPKMIARPDAMTSRNATEERDVSATTTTSSGFIAPVPGSHLRLGIIPLLGSELLMCSRLADEIAYRLLVTGLNIRDRLDDLEAPVLGRLGNMNAVHQMVSLAVDANATFGSIKFKTALERVDNLVFLDASGLIGSRSP